MTVHTKKYANHVYLFSAAALKNSWISNTPDSIHIKGSNVVYSCAKTVRFIYGFWAEKAGYLTAAGGHRFTNVKYKHLETEGRK
ncbi:hypothetical protein E2R68_04015 [Psychromonas sp. RZ22]|uniref:hypothetical protein n=1 Tax=Psychromonas algarum TaxID=2555643 RepID=UPI001067B541|nr:hypothetical protein [Psychromonas sp. RZ22]TEW55561.1 hypothetical protein E2R68_04015 [Psychromonas sp. RZ22]